MPNRQNIFRTKEKDEGTGAEAPGEPDATEADEPAPVVVSPLPGETGKEPEESHTDPLPASAGAPERPSASADVPSVRECPFRTFPVLINKLTKEIVMKFLNFLFLPHFVVYISAS